MTMTAKLKPVAVAGRPADAAVGRLCQTVSSSVVSCHHQRMQHLHGHMQQRLYFLPPNPTSAANSNEN